MLALGEMSTRFPSKKGFAGHATRCVDPAFGFATALVYLCKVRYAAFQDKGWKLTKTLVPHHLTQPDRGGFSRRSILEPEHQRGRMGYHPHRIRHRYQLLGHQVVRRGRVSPQSTTRSTAL